MGEAISGELIPAAAAANVKPIRQFLGASPESFVVQANSLARTKYSDAQNVHGLRLLVVAIAKVDHDMDMLNQVTITNGELRSIFPSYRSTNNLSRYVSDATDRIMSLRAETWEGDGNWKKVNLISDAKYRAGRGGLTITFHPDMSKYLLQITGNFTRYQLKAIAKLSTKHQLQLFQFLRSHAYHRNVVVTVEDLRALTGHQGKEYREFRDYRRRVLTPALEAINEHSDIVVSVEPLKEGRRYGAVEFKVSVKDGVTTVFDRAAVDVLVAHGITQRAARDATRQFSPIHCMAILAHCKARFEDQTKEAVRDKAAFIATMLRTGVTVDPMPPAMERHLLALKDQFRAACFEHFEPHEQRRWLAEFKTTLTGRDKVDFDRFGDSLETGSLRAAFARFLRENVNPDTPNFRLST